MKVRHDEGVANCIGPEPCAGTREGASDASVGECTGQPSSRERPLFRTPTPFCWRKAIRMATTARVSIWPGVVVEPGMWCAGETGKEQRVRVPYDEGVANRIGPEPCASNGEASVGECIGQPLSRERVVSGADTVTCVEGNTYGRDIASAHMPRRGQRPWHGQTLLVSGNRESSRSTARSMAAGPRQEGEEP